MKKIVMMMAALMLTATMSAQPDPSQKPKEMTPAERVQMKTDKMTKRYGLTDKQAKKVQKLNEKYQGKFAPGHKKFREGMTNPPRRPDKAQMEQMKKDHEAYNAELKGIMTAEQYQKYQADAKKRFAEHKPHAKHHAKPDKKPCCKGNCKGNCKADSI